MGGSPRALRPFEYVESTRHRGVEDEGTPVWTETGESNSAGLLQGHARSRQESASTVQTSVIRITCVIWISIAVAGITGD